MYSMPKSKRTSASDRFIPLRRSFQSDIANYKIKGTTRIEEPTVAFSSCDNMFLNTAKYIYNVQNYKNSLWSATFPTTDRILLFSSPKKPKIKDHRKEVPTKTLWPVKARKRPMLGPPSTMLDMPGIDTNLRHQVIDWGKTGYLATIYEGEVHLWHPEKKVEKTCTTNTDGYVHEFVKWDRTGTCIAMKTQRNQVMVWDCVKVKEKMLFCGMCSPLVDCMVTAIEWSPDNRYLLLACSCGSVTVHGYNHFGTSHCYRQRHKKAITRLQFSCNGRYLATTGLDNRVHVYSWPNFDVCFAIRHEALRTISWHPWKEPLLVIGGNDCISLHNVSTYENLSRQSHIHAVDLTLLDAISFNPLSAELVASYYSLDENSQYALQLLTVLSDFETIVDEVHFHIGRVPYLLWDHSGTKLATASADENLCVWDFFGTSSNVKKNKKNKLLTTDMSKTVNMLGPRIR